MGRKKARKQTCTREIRRYLRRQELRRNEAQPEKNVRPQEEQQQEQQEGSQKHHEQLQLQQQGPGRPAEIVAHGRRKGPPIPPVPYTDGWTPRVLYLSEPSNDAEIVHLGRWTQEQGKTAILRGPAEEVAEFDTTMTTLRLSCKKVMVVWPWLRQGATCECVTDSATQDGERLSLSLSISAARKCMEEHGYTCSYAQGEQRRDCWRVVAFGEPVRTESLSISSWIPKWEYELK
eukprot:GHVT01037346.1.p1 GENE.GHVT01037346.1~~GHVT01037346.1.p1  ORF type:complete len:233 (-),score=50.42 GHVT01037346.1:895-1593(-)